MGKILKNPTIISNLLVEIKTSINNKENNNVLSELPKNDVLCMWHDTNNTHKYEVSKVIQSTCTEKGEKTYTCECGDFYTEEIDVNPDNHEYDETDHCIRCGILNPDHVHEYDSGVVTKEPTHTENGIKTYTCRCGDTYIEEIAKLGHTYDQGVITKQPTCTEKGIKTFTCIGADDSYTEEIPALGHISDNGTVKIQPTCTVDGSKEYKCTRCNTVIRTDKIDRLGHNYSTSFTTAGSKSKHCTRCSSKSEVTSIPALGHSWNSGVITKQPTCTNKGVKTFTCTRCNETRTEEVAALGHAFNADIVCTRCGVIKQTSGVVSNDNKKNFTYKKVQSNNKYYIDINNIENQETGVSVINIYNHYNILNDSNLYKTRLKLFGLLSPKSFFVNDVIINIDNGFELNMENPYEGLPNNIDPFSDLSWISIQSNDHVKEINGLKYIFSNPQFQQPTNTSNAFLSCTKLTKLDLRGLDMRKVADASFMFYNCPNLKQILVSRDKWVLPSGCNTNGMFQNCGCSAVTKV